MTQETNDVVTQELIERLRRKELVSILCTDDCTTEPVPLPEPQPMLVNPDGPDVIALIQSQSARIAELRTAGNTLAETVKLIKHVLVSALSKRELEIVMGDLHAWNVVSLTKDSTSATG